MEQYRSSEESAIIGEIFSGIFKKKAAKSQASADQMKSILDIVVQREKTKTEAEANKVKKIKLIVTIVGIVLVLITIIIVVKTLKKPN
jgi:hypothetical protein